MRYALATALILIGTAAMAEIEIYPENKPIANAAYVLKHANIFESTKLDILSTDRAVLLGGRDAPVLVAKVGECTFAIKARGYTGYKIDFSKLNGDYTLQRSGYSWQIVFPGERGVACSLNDGAPDMCFSEVRLNEGDPLKRTELLASVAYITEHGCPLASRPQPKPRF